MSTRNIPGFTAEVALYRTVQQYRANSPYGASTGQVKSQLMVGGDSENLLVCLGACLCCVLCEPGPWQRASCNLCYRCVGRTPPIIAVA